MTGALEQFFYDGETVRVPLVREALRQLRHILAVLLRRPLFRLYSSSILFVYDQADRAARVRVKMIDFAHAHRVEDGHPDHNYIYGLRFLMSTLQSVLAANTLPHEAHPHHQVRTRGVHPPSSPHRWWADTGR